MNEEKDIDIEVATADPNRKLHFVEPPHHSDRFDAGTGQGTVKGFGWGEELQERSVLDGSSEVPRVEVRGHHGRHAGGGEPDAFYGQPSLNTASSKQWLIAGVVSAVVVSVALLWLLQWSPLLCGIALVAVMLLLLAMVFVRKRVVLNSRPRGLHIESVLLVLIWAIPIVTIIIVLITSVELITS